MNCDPTHKSTVVAAPLPVAFGGSYAAYGRVIFGNVGVLAIGARKMKSDRYDIAGTLIAFVGSAMLVYGQEISGQLADNNFNHTRKLNFQK